MEEGTELITRVTKGGVLPMMTSCCPAWVSYLERNYPELKDHLSSCKSPQQMMGAVLKTYGAELNKVEPAKIFSVSIMPCTCKEFECSREEMKDSGYQDVDAVLTTRELAWLIKDLGIDFHALPDEEFDNPLGDYTGAGTIFGVTGGVMEAAIRTGYELITGQPIPSVDVTPVRGTDGFRVAHMQVGDLTLKVGVVTGLKNVVPVMEAIKAGTCDLHFIEVMTCPEGCVSGGGQPKLLLDADRPIAYAARRQATFVHDKDLPLRKSHENPSITKIYKEFLHEPNGHKSHELLHTHYCTGANDWRK
jgi:ferredoxin hydrogenase